MSGDYEFPLSELASSRYDRRSAGTFPGGVFKGFGVRSGMRLSMTGGLGDDRNPAAPSSSTITASPHDLRSDIEALLQPFLEQSAAIRSIVAVGCCQILGLPGEDIPAAP